MCNREKINYLIIIKSVKIESNRSLSFFLYKGDIDNEKYYKSKFKDVSRETSLSN